MVHFAAVHKLVDHLQNNKIDIELYVSHENRDFAWFEIEFEGIELSGGVEYMYEITQTHPGTYDTPSDHEAKLVEFNVSEITLVVDEDYQKIDEDNEEYLKNLISFNIKEK